MDTVAGVPTRDRTLDVLRAIATLRVVVFHATGDVRWSWFAAMPVMFFVGGALYGTSIDRRPPLEVLRSRLRRIMIPTWVWGAFVFITFTAYRAWDEVPWWGAVGYVVPVFSPTGPTDPAGPLYWTWMHMWYISAYVLLMVVGIPLRRLHRRWPIATFAVLLAPVVLSGILREPEVGGLTFIIVFWVAGYEYRDRQDRLPESHVSGSIAIAAGAAAALYAAAFTGFGTDIKGIPFLFDLAGLAMVATAIALRPAIARLCDVRAVDVIVTWFQQRALTVYLWHALAVGIVVNALGRPTMPDRSDFMVIGLVLPITFVLVTLLGWIEDLAAGRPPRLFPAIRSVDLRDSSEIDLKPWIPSDPADNIDVRHRAHDPTAGH